MNPASSLQIVNVCKSFLGKIVINQFNYCFQPGCYAIKGPNGIGKTTLLNIISGSIPYDSGTILFNDLDFKKHPIKAKEMIGYIPDQSIIYPFITGQEFINLIAYIKKITNTIEINRLLEDFNVKEYLEVRFDKMSLGTKKKFFFIAGFMNKPKFLIMDEPTNAIDVNTKDLIISMINNRKHQDIILMSTHDDELIKKTKPTEIYLRK